MIITRPDVDIISVDEEKLENFDEQTRKNKIHIIKLDLIDPTEEKMDKLLDNFFLTNRFVIKDNIKFYNWYFKTKNKKYYVENNSNSGIFSFFKKNNKILLNFNKVRHDVKTFLIKDFVFTDVLKNLEIIEIDSKLYFEKYNILNRWNGNVVVNINE